MGVFAQTQGRPVILEDRNQKTETSMPTRIQRVALKLWPVTVVVMIVVFPFLVRRSYRELVSGKQ